MKDLMRPRRASPSDAGAWKGDRPWDEGAYGNGYPLDLTVLAIEDYASRGSSGPVRAGMLRCAEAMAEEWKRTTTGSLFLHPRATVLKDGQVTARHFTGDHPWAFQESDMVVFCGHGTSQGPWLGQAEGTSLMAPANYAWSGGRSKWFVNHSCQGLFDGGFFGEPDSHLLTVGNAGRDGAGNPVPELGGWGKAMGWESAIKDRLHAIFGYRSLSWFNGDSRQREPSQECPAALEFRRGRNWEAYPAFTFIKALMNSDKALEEQGLPKGMGDLWMYCVNFQYRMTGIPGVAPAVFAYRTEDRDDPGRPLLDYFDESFHAPFPSPGRLESRHVLVLKCRTQVFGTPEF